MWEFNQNVKMELPELTLEAYDRFVKESFMEFFIPKDALKVMREKFIRDNNLEE